MDIKQRIIMKLKEKTGAAYSDYAIIFLIFIMVLVLILQFVPVLILKNQLNTYATNVCRILAVEGIYNEDVKDKIEEYRQTTEVGDVTLSLEGTEFISGTDKIQLNDMIVVTVTTEYDIGFFNFGSFMVPLKNMAQTRSEVYWK